MVGKFHSNVNLSALFTLRCRAFLSLSFLLVFQGCQVPSRMALEGSGGRNAYNVALQVTDNEQMLLNLVRLRYYDIPFFMGVSNVTTQFTYRAAVSPVIPVPGFTEDNPAELGFDFSWLNQPTIQYAPLQGEAYAGQLLQPISLRAIQQLCYSGWDIDRLFRLVVQGFNGLLNAPEASGPLPEQIPCYSQFLEATALLRHFQMRGELQIGVDVVKSILGKEEAPKEDKTHHTEGQTLQFAFPAEGREAERLAALLPGATLHKGRYLVNMELGFNQDGKVGVIPRSILSSMYYLSQGIDIPKSDLQRGCVSRVSCFKEKGCEWEQMDDLIRIKCSGSRPNSVFLSVSYRGRWFYIDDTDLSSKKTFVLLMQLYNLQGGATTQIPPLLTIPIGR